MKLKPAKCIKTNPISESNLSLSRFVEVLGNHVVFKSPRTKSLPLVSEVTLQSDTPHTVPLAGGSLRPGQSELTLDSNSDPSILPDWTPPDFRSAKFKKRLEEMAPPPLKTSKMDTANSASNSNDNSNLQYTVPIYNKYGVLTQEPPTINQDPMSDTDNMDTETSTPKNEVVKLPPVKITSKIKDYAILHKRLSEILKGEYSVRYLNSTINVHTTTKSDFNALKEDLKASNTEFFTYTPKNEREKKIVLKAAPNLLPTVITDILKAQDIEIKNCTALNSKKKNAVSTSYLISTTNDANIKKLRNISAIDHVKTKWEKYSKPSKVAQCFNCQRFGHGSSNCNYKPRCLKCIHQHKTAECPIKEKTATSTVQCCNCQGPHTANYKGCPVLTRYLNEISQQASKNTHTPTKQFTNTSNNNFPPLKNHNQTHSNTVTPSKSYSQAINNSNSTSNSNINTLNSLINEVKLLNNICDLQSLLNLVTEMRQAFEKTSSNIDRVVILQNLIAKYD